jgi:hypothetical protein
MSETLETQLSLYVAYQAGLITKFEETQACFSGSDLHGEYL